MADFISDLAAKSGISPDLAGKGVGIVLALLKDKLPAGTYSQLQAAIPSSDRLMADAQQPSQGEEVPRSGIVDLVTSAAGQLFGGGGGVELLKKLTQLGFSPEQLQKFLPNLAQGLEQKLPPDAAKQVSALIPAGEPVH